MFVCFSIQRTATKAVIELEPGQSLGDGFQLLIGLAEIHVPRMWVERHTNNSDRQVSGQLSSVIFRIEHLQSLVLLM